MSDTTSKPTRRTRATRTRKPPVPAPAPTPTLPDRLAQRVIVEHVEPEIDGGRFPIKRTPGQRVVVTAAIHADGHDVLAASLWYRHVLHSANSRVLVSASAPDPADAWQEAVMVPLGNDEWAGSFTVGDLGGAEYTIQAWVDTFASWRKGLAAKVQAGQDVSSELLEGAAYLRDAASRSPRADFLLDRAVILASDAESRDRETA